MISSAQMYLYLALFHCRDYFFRPASSLSCSFLPQGLFLPLRCISILLFFTAGITSSAQMHLYLALLCCRDYFGRPASSLSCFFLHRDYCDRPDSSLSCSFVPQGLLLLRRFISILLFFTTGITATARIHLYLTLLCRRDDFFCSDSSLSCSFSPQGLFLAVMTYLIRYILASAIFTSSSRVIFSLISSSVPA